MAGMKLLHAICPGILLTVSSGISSAVASEFEVVKTDAVLISAAESARERLRRAELLEITEALREIYAELQKTNVPDLERSRRLAPIAARYENLIQQFPNDAEALVLYAKFLRDGGDDAGAREYFEKVQKLKPDWAVVYQQLAAIAAEEGDVSRALPLMQKALALEPGTIVYQLQYGELLTMFREKLLKLKIFETPERLDRTMQNAFRAARALAPQSPNTAIRYAESFYDVVAPDWSAALDAWNMARKNLMSSPDFGTNPAVSQFMRETIDLHRARAYAELGNYAAAEEIIRSVKDERLAHSRKRIRQMIFEKRNLIRRK